VTVNSLKFIRTEQGLTRYCRENKPCIFAARVTLFRHKLVWRIYAYLVSLLKFNTNNMEWHRSRRAAERFIIYALHAISYTLYT